MEYTKELHENFESLLSITSDKTKLNGIEAGVIKTFLSEITRLQSLTQWIPVSERLPENDVPVLGCFAGKPAVDTCVVFEGEWWQVGHKINVTHWMPLPLPPEGVK